MLVPITAKQDLNDYLTNLISFVKSIKDLKIKTESDMFMNIPSVDYLPLLDFKLKQGMLDQLKVNSDTGFITGINLSRIKAEKRNIDFKLGYTTSPEDIRDQLIDRLDGFDLTQIKRYDLNNLTESLADRVYISMLQKANIDNNVILSSRIVEEGEDSDLIKVLMTGYSLPYSSEASCEMDIYFSKKALKKRKIKLGVNCECNLDKKLEDQLEDWFGLESDVIYEHINREKGIEPRRVSRTIFGPFYGPFFALTEDILKIDPYAIEISKAFLMEEKNVPYIFSVHNDNSTEHFNFYDEEVSGKPQMETQHVYFCNEKKVSEKLKDIIPDSEVILI
jgi:hypothetical protein